MDLYVVNVKIYKCRSKWSLSENNYDTDLSTSAIQDEDSSATVASAVVILYELYGAVIATESSVDITKTTISYISPSNDIDTKSSAVSIVEEATSSYDLSNTNPSSLNYNNGLHFDTVVLYLVLIYKYCCMIKKTYCRTVLVLLIFYGCNDPRYYHTILRPVLYKQSLLSR